MNGNIYESDSGAGDHGLTMANSTAYSRFGSKWQKWQKQTNKKDQLIDTDYTGFLVNAYIKKDYYGLNLIKWN